MHNEKISNQRAVFSSRFAAVATTVGSAVGLGNIWRFPYEAGTHGGGAFLLCYIAFILILGLPLLCAEYAMGRSTRSNIFGAYRKLSGSSKWSFTGYIGIIASMLILGFYSVVAGWTAEYFLYSVTGQLDFSNADTCHHQFVELTTGARPVIWTVVFLICNFMILVRGVTSGIEKASNILMPVLFVLLVAFCINSTTLPKFGEGVYFLFHPNFSAINGPVLLNAMGQAFFSLSLGLGCMMTYASYFSNETRLGRTAFITAILDLAVAVLSGIIIFPAVFSFGLSPQAGPTLVFEVLPYIFTHLPAGAVWASLFFLLLFLASLTSTISMSEISISYFCDEKKMSRRKATVISSVIGLAGALLCALSFGPLKSLTLAGMTFFSLFDYISSNICLPIGGLICSIFTGWLIDRKVLREQFTDNGTFRFRLLGVLVFMLRWICPVAIILIFLNSLGII